jgi:hypothetical protein
MPVPVATMIMSAGRIFRQQHGLADGYQLGRYRTIHDLEKLGHTSRCLGPIHLSRDPENSSVLAAKLVEPSSRVSVPCTHQYCTSRGLFGCHFPAIQEVTDKHGPFNVVHAGRRLHLTCSMSRAPSLNDLILTR